MAKHNSIKSTSYYDTSILDSASGPVPFTLTNDYLFRIVMQENQNVLKGLICSLLHLRDDEIDSIQLRNPIIPGEQIDDKTIILDLHILLNNRQLLNIEMQVTNYNDWPERSVGYLCREFNHLNRGAAYADTLPAHHIGILKFTLFPDYPEFYATHKLMNVKNQHIYSDKFTLSVLDLTQIDRATEEDIIWRLDYWAGLFLARTWEDIKMLAEENDVIKEAAATMYAVSAEENIRLQCEARERYNHDQEAAIGCGIKLGREEGIKEGLEQGFKEGHNRLATLINLLISDHRNDEIPLVTTDQEYCEKLCKEYHI